MRRGGLAALVAVAILACSAGTASARTGTITSFDGTQIKVNFFPKDAAVDGKRAPTVRAPTVLFGPGWGQPGATDPEAATDTTIGAIGIGPLRAAGYNVLTWDPRGFGDSGGTVEVDSPDAEALDVKQLVSYVARQPEAELDHKGDPRVGMTGASYGGGIQFASAALDRRIDAIVPDIAWHSLTTSLYKDQTFKAGWGTLLYALGKAVGNLDPHIDSAFASGQATGHISDSDAQWFASRGPGDLVKKVHVPTLLIQGTVDTLFTLNEAITNYKILHHKGVPLKMVWFCGGHGSCLTNPGDPTRIDRVTLAWLDRYLKQRPVSQDWTGIRLDQPGRPGLHREGVPAGEAAGDQRHREGIAADHPGRWLRPVGRRPGRRRRAGRPDQRHPRNERRQRPDQRRAQDPAARRRAEALARLLRHRIRPRRPRLRPARRRQRRRRPRQPGHPDPAAARRQVAHAQAQARGGRAHAAPGLQRHPADHLERHELRHPARHRNRRLLEDRPEGAGRPREVAEALDGGPGTIDTP